MDSRLQLLSYSSLLTLHSCPRKYQLYKLGASASEDSFEESVTFAFGHAVGLGIQLVFENKTEEQIIWELALNWKPDLFASDEKRFKSFWYAIHAIQKFISMRKDGFLADWELVTVDNLPAVELGFTITLPDSYTYRGFVDAVLRNKLDGRVMVLECKTTGAKYLNAAQYKNSAQAIGYSIVLDHLFPDLSSYEVLYLVYMTHSKLYETFPFPKSYLQRALWIQELLLDVEFIKMCENSGVYPMHGESCFSFNKECKYLGNCTLSTQYLTTPLTPEDEDTLKEKESKYQIQVSIQDLIQAQLTKA